MDEKQTIQKMKILKYFLLFLAAMLILTFVSRGIYAYHLPRVTISNMKNTTLDYQIKATGTVQTKSSLPLYAMPELRITKVYVKNGDIVEKGDMLLKYDTTYLVDYIAKLSKQIQIDTMTRSDHSVQKSSPFRSRRIKKSLTLINNYWIMVL